MTDRTRELLDRMEIADLLARYALAVDTGRWSLLDSVFHPDAVLDYTATGGAKGALPEVRGWLSEVLPAFPGRLHLLGPPAIAFDGDHAGVTVAFTDTLAPSREPLGRDAPGLIQGGGYYHHRMERTPSGWRSRELVVEQTWRVFH
ncbi:nuclear transport factor 2 family protein [Actinocorallia sp. A-T 12471]|uniref:nuclear transport factor 2 family protein n=1 Tax=Actinocorallia sp. A-T 12471 TaxID=3089813 RepID=UPI0029CF9691|nr:nuclear transport factor 2 family protein [Actinocorallia sp. A-T 12471]MDX6739988.1 nuclear transport factor 2 family protein [Actinocorallia sp. A-T 12471]